MRLPADKTVDFNVADILAPDTMIEKVGQTFLPFGLESADFQSGDVCAVNRRYIVLELRGGKIAACSQVKIPAV